MSLWSECTAFGEECRAGGAGSPGGDDQILTAQPLYINQVVQGAIDAIAGPNGAAAEQAAGLAQATMCTQASD